MHYIKNSENKTIYNKSKIISKIPIIPIKQYNEYSKISDTTSKPDNNYFYKSNTIDKSLNTARTTLSTPRNIKKSVKFNKYIEVIKVASYKKYNKEEELSIADYFDENYNYKPYNKRKKEEIICKCIII